jgi:ribosomal protein L6P/L9E
MFVGGLASRKISKQQIVMLSNDEKVSNVVSGQLSRVRWINHYTKRGVRCAKQFVVKRPGKKTTY